MSAQPVDPFAGGDSVPSISFKDAPMGTAFAGTITVAPSMAQSRDFKTQEPAFWPDGNPKMSVVTRLVLPSGEERSLWAGKPSAMFAAIAEAQKAAGALIAVGGHLTITLIGEKPAASTNLSAQKLYSAVYTPPNAFAEAPPVAAVQGWQTPPQAAPPAFVPPAATPVAAVPAGPTPEQIAAYLATQAPIVPPPVAAYTPEQIAAARAAGIPLPGI